MVMDIINATKGDCQKEVTMREKGTVQAEHWRKRAGRPKNEWWKHALTEYWRYLCIRVENI